MQWNCLDTLHANYIMTVFFLSLVLASIIVLNNHFKSKHLGYAMAGGLGMLCILLKLYPSQELMLTFDLTLLWFVVCFGDYMVLILYSLYASLSTEPLVKTAGQSAMYCHKYAYFVNKSHRSVTITTCPFFLLFWQRNIPMSMQHSLTQPSALKSLLGV